MFRKKYGNLKIGDCLPIFQQVQIQMLAMFYGKDKDNTLSRSLFQSQFLDTIA
jgi:hypothetical protein